MNGPPLRIDLPENPPLKFHGHREIWKMVGTKEMVESIENVLRNLGIVYSVHTEEQTPEQAEERRQLMGENPQ